MAGMRRLRVVLSRRRLRLSERRQILAWRDSIFFEFLLNLLSGESAKSRGLMSCLTSGLDLNIFRPHV